MNSAEPLTGTSRRLAAPGQLQLRASADPE